MGKHEVKRPAVFLDRDGTIIEHVDSITKNGQIRVISGVPEALRMLHELGFLLIVITNQSVVSRGMITARGVENMNKMLNKRLSSRGYGVDAFYFCPHVHEDACLCRKPGIAFIKQAVKKYAIDLKTSFFIGDSTRDIETGRRAKLETILVKTGKAGKDAHLFTSKPDFIVKDFSAAAKLIKKLK